MKQLPIKYIRRVKQSNEVTTKEWREKFNANEKTENISVFSENRLKNYVIFSSSMLEHFGHCNTWKWPVDIISIAKGWENKLDFPVWIDFLLKTIFFGVELINYTTFAKYIFVFVEFLTDFFIFFQLLFNRFRSIVIARAWVWYWCHSTSRMIWIRPFILFFKSLNWTDKNDSCMKSIIFRK